MTSKMYIVPYADFRRIESSVVRMQGSKNDTLRNIAMLANSYMLRMNKLYSFSYDKMLWMICKFKTVIFTSCLIQYLIIEKWSFCKYKNRYSITYHCK